MKIPKSLRILNKVVKLVPDKKIEGGSFDWSVPEIRYNPTKSKEFQIETLLHEVLELILAVRDFRWTQFGGEAINDQMIFCFNHKEYMSICMDLAAVVNQFIKEVK